VGQNPELLSVHPPRPQSDNRLKASAQHLFDGREVSGYTLVPAKKLANEFALAEPE
jgi:hypothetical protein